MASKSKSDDIKGVEFAGVGRVGAGSSGVGLPSTDRLSLNLQFATDKSLTARKGPTPTFTRASTATFVGSNGLIQSAAINTARFDHDPVTLACKGLLIEESRTNSVTRSQEMNLWSGAGGSTRVVSTENSPDGGATKGTLASGGSAGFGDIVARSLSGLTAVISTQYTVSCFVKKINYRYVSVDYHPIRPGGATLPFFDLDTLVFNANGATVTGSITAYPNGWYRLTVSGAGVRADTAGVDVTLCSSTGTAGASRAGEQIYLWGAQLEAGAFPTSYIPTTTASVVRSADVCSITGAAFTGFYNQSEGTFFAAADPRATTSSATYLMANSGANTNQVAIFRTTAISTFGVASSGSYTAEITAASANGSFNKIAGSYFTNDAQAAFNGALGSADTSVTVPTNLNRLNIGSAGAASTEFANGCISSIRYYRKRLSNAKLQTLTT